MKTSKIYEYDKSIKSLNISAIDMKNKAFSPQDKFLQQFARKMHDGGAVKIGCYGDSTYYGVLYTTNIATRPAPSVMQDLLRVYFNNNNITVVNHGVSVQATWNIVDTWDNLMSSSDEDIIYINYGINNRWRDVNYLKQNLTTMIAIAREYNKEVVLDCPNIVMQINPQGGIDSNGSPIGGNSAHCYATLEHAQVTRDLARDLGVCYIDNYELTQQYNYFNTNLALNSADGMHPSQKLYFKKASNMCIPFIAPNCAKVKSGDIISAVDSSVIVSGDTASGYAVENNSIVKSLATGNKVAIGLFVEENGVDISLAMISKNSSPDNIYINLDGEYIGSFSPKTLNTNSYFFIDNEFVALKGLTRGLHIIQLSTDAGKYIELNYLKVYKANRQVVNINKYCKETISTNSSTNVITDIVTDNYAKDLDISFKCKIPNKKGVSIFTNVCSNGGSAYGATLYISDGYIAFAECNQEGYIGKILIAPDTNYKDTEHIYRFVLPKNSKNLTIYCDDTVLKSVTLAQNYLGGHVGIFSMSSANLKVEVEKLI